MTSGLFTLQQYGAPAHWAQETVQLLSERTDARLIIYGTQELATQLF